jgi:hypothetical protein
MNVTRVEVGIDCAEPEPLIEFWMHALGYQRESAGGPTIVDPQGDGPPIWFQKVPEAKVMKNRLHFDVWLDDEAAVVARRDELVAIGATAVKRDFDFWLMNDPEGNEFCLCWPVPQQALV